MAKNETAREIGRGGSKFRRPKNAGAAIARVFKYVSEYKVRMVLVIIGIIVSAAANIAGTYLLTPIINNYIIPLIGKQNPDLSGLVRILVLMGGIYLVGVICMYMYQRIMVTVSTGTLLRLREDMFKHMQKLPLKYFDAHTHGEIMSRYTNDIDAMREMLSQGVPQLINSVIRITGVFIMMIVLSPLLTLLALAMLGIIFLVVKLLMKKSSVFYKRRQKMLGEANGYIEEMIEGQKVVKVFCHEDAVKERFDDINSRLCAAMASADTWASILMPIMNNLGHFHYAATAVVGGVMLTAANPAISIGSLASFLQYTRNFSMPITQLSQQFNSAMSALAGAERIFELRALGYDVSQSELSCRGTMTRLTIANLLVKNGFATDRSDAFKRLIGAGKPAYADFERIDSEEAIRLINGAGGISVIAHPCKMHGNPHAAIAKLANAGLWGVEAFYPSSTQGQKELFISIAAQNGLRTTCGSDFHGANRPNVTVGMSCEPSKLLDKTASEIMRRREHKMLTK